MIIQIVEGLFKSEKGGGGSPNFILAITEQWNNGSNVIRKILYKRV